MPVGARSSSTKNWGWPVAQRRCLNGSTILVQAPTLDAKLAAKGYLLCQGQPNSEESSIVVESRSTCSPVAKHLQRSSLAVWEFCAAGKEHFEQGHRQVCANLWCRMSWRLKRIRAIAAMYLSSVDLPSIYYARIWHGGRLHGGPQKKH